MSRQSGTTGLPEWSLSRRLKSRIIGISLLMTVLVTGSVTMHYGYDIPELQQRTVFGLAGDIALDMPFDAEGPELLKAIDSRHDLFTRYPDAYEWYVLDEDGVLVGSSVSGRVDRADFPPGLPPRNGTRQPTRVDGRRARPSRRTASPGTSSPWPTRILAVCCSV